MNVFFKPCSYYSCKPLHKATFLLFTLLVSGLFCLGQKLPDDAPASDIHFDLLTVKDGLPYNIIHAIAYDKQGFLWIATSEGLCRYDGSSFITYKHNPHDSTSVMSNQINSLSADSKGMMWGSTRNGLFRLDVTTGIFTNYYPRPNDPSAISCDNLGRLFIDSKDNLYVGSWTDYNVFDPVKKTFRQYRHNEKDAASIRENKVGDTYEDRKGRIWVGTFSGLDLLDPLTHSFRHIHLPSLFRQFGGGPLINDFYDDGKGHLWMTTWGSGLIRYTFETGETKIFSIEKDRILSGSTNVATKILHTDYPGEENKLWIATKSSGLYLFDMQTEVFTGFAETTFGNPKFITGDINTLFDDGVGNIFIGTGEGLMRYSRSKKLFHTITLPLKPIECLTDVFAVYQDPADISGNTLWLGTWTCGGYKYDLNTKVLQRITEISRTSDPEKKYSTVNNFHRDHKGNLWSFCNEGIRVLKKNTEHWINLPADDSNPEKLWQAAISTFREETDGTFWFASRKGLVHYNPDVEKAERVNFMTKGEPKIEFSSTMSFTEYPENIFWVVGAKGVLIKYNATNKTTAVFRHNPRDPASFPVLYDLREIFLAKNHRIWMGSNNGLISFNPLDLIPVYKIFHTNDGLPSESVFSITEDSEGKIWCATQNGISRLDPKTLTFRNFGLSDGLLDLYMTNAFTHFPSGKIFIGQHNRIQYIDPRHIGRNNYCGPIYITGIKVLGKDYRGENTPVFTDSVRLSYRQNEITISFAMINYAQGNQTNYDYFLEGLNEDWIPVGKNHSVTFTNLDGGSYYLKVRGYNADGVCEDGKRILTLIVTPPFWRTTWFFVLVVIIICGCIFAYNRMRLRSLKKQKKELEATVEHRTEQLQIQKERAEQSERFKEQFLANMSHEIRTPMNAVMGMTNLLLDKNPRQDQFNYLDGMKKSSETLLHIINDILDLSKIEAGKIELEHIHFSIRDVVEQVKQILRHKAEEKGLHLITDVHGAIPEVVIGDPVRLNQVLMNLAGNAIKFTEKGSVTLEVQKGSVENGITFSIIDTGIGIPKDKLQTVFESFSQSNASDTRKFGGTGLGLTISKQLVELLGGRISIRSEEGAGSTFSFEIIYAPGSKEKLNAQISAEHIDGSILDGLKILIVDDNEYNRIVAKDTLLSKAKVDITEASNGKEALEIFSIKDFDVVLMDVQMPVMNGYDTTRHIREKFPSPKNRTPVLALTASVIRSDLDKCRQAGMDDYIPKPFKTAQLISAIAKAAGREIRFAEDGKAAVKNKKFNGTSAVTDLSYLETFCEGDKVRMQKYISMFLDTAPALIKEINSALAKRDYEEIASQIHGYKTKWIMMGMHEAKELAIKIEKECREEPPGESVPENTTILTGLIQAAINELHQTL